jgi:hypothetical protein
MPKINCNNYSHSLKVSNAAALLLDSDKIPQMGKIGSVAVATQIPIIAVAHYFGQMYGYTSQLYGYIERLCKFYDVNEVIHFNAENSSNK